MVVLSASAKEDYLEVVKGRLIELNIRCTTCHPADPASPPDKPAPLTSELTPYGRRLADLGRSAALAGRIGRLERRLPTILPVDQRKEELLRVDIDSDGTLNWVEILAGTDPSDPNSVPNEGDPALRDLRTRVESVVSCRLCHTRDATDLKRDDAPHNDFGEALAALAEGPAAGARPGQSPAGRGRGGAASARGDVPLDIVERLLKVQHQDADRDRARNWDEIAAFHHPADPADAPTADEVQAVRAAAAALKRGDVGFGRFHAAP